MKDEKLAELAGELRDLRGKEKALKKKIGRVQDRLLAEMEKRDAAMEIVGGLKINYIAPEPVGYDTQKAEKYLTEEQFERATERVINKKILEEMVELGEVKVKVIDKFSFIKEVSPHIKVDDATAEDEE